MNCQPNKIKAKTNSLSLNNISMHSTITKNSGECDFSE